MIVNILVLISANKKYKKPFDLIYICHVVITCFSCATIPNKVQRKSPL